METADDNIGDCTQGTEQESVETKEKCPEYGVGIFPETECEASQDSPYIQVRNPPEAKAKEQAFQQDKDGNDIKAFLLVNKCKDGNQQRDQFDIGDGSKGQFGSFQRCRQQADGNNIPGF